MIPFLTVLLLLLAAISSVSTQFAAIRRPIFDCRRVHPSYCCTTRIREACAALCASVPCARPATEPGRSPWGQPMPPPAPPQPFPPPPQARANGPGPSEFQPPPPETTPPVFPAPMNFMTPAPPQAVTPANPFAIFGLPPPLFTLPPLPGFPTFPPFGGIGIPAPTPSPTEPPGMVFPTLVPEAGSGIPSISSFIDEKSIQEVVEERIGKNGAIDGVVHPPDSKVKKKKGIIAPPHQPGESLVELVPGTDTDYPDEVKVVPVTRKPLSATPPSPPQAVVPTPTPAPSELSIDSQRTTVAVREGEGQGLGRWKFSIKPSALSAKPPNPFSSAGGKNGTGGIFNEKLGELIGSFFNNKSLPSNAFTSARAHSPPPIPEWAAVTPIAETNAPPPVAGSPEPVPIPVNPEPGVCGVGPEFVPCVPSEKASTLLLDCCKKRLMPPGCLELCRYDITQVEIRKAFDAGKCGILHVAPFLECASNGNNNLPCCKARDLAKRSGPQCEVFCNPAGGLGQLGLQHLACQNIIGDLLRCHHSGIRPF